MDEQRSICSKLGCSAFPPEAEYTKIASEPLLDADKGRIASSKMLPDNFLVMTGAVPPNQFGGRYGEKHQHGRAARGFGGGSGTVPNCPATTEGAHSR